MMVLMRYSKRPTVLISVEVKQTLSRTFFEFSMPSKHSMRDSTTIYQYRNGAYLPGVTQSIHTDFLDGHRLNVVGA